MKKTLLAVSALAAFSAFSAFSTNASAEKREGIAACGNIDVSASATCVAEVEGGCTAKCTPVSFQAACAAKVDFSGCEGSCNVDVEASCTGSCQGSCEAECTAKPAEFTCEGQCKGSCTADCSGQCAGEAAGSEARANCEGSCQAGCKGRCEGSCKATPPSADCKAKCEGSCSGSCKAKANASCDIQCTGSAVAKCTADLKGGCTARCSQPQGALYCDGQYMDQDGNAETCINALKAQLNVKYSASGNAECSGGECKAEGEAAASCGTIAGSRAVGGEFALGAGLLGLAFGVSRIRRRKLAPAAHVGRRIEGVSRTHRAPDAFVR